MKLNQKHLGSTIEEWLEEEGILDRDNQFRNKVRSGVAIGAGNEETQADQDQDGRRHENQPRPIGSCA